MIGITHLGSLYRWHIRPDCVNFDDILCEPDCATGPVGLGGCRAHNHTSFDVCSYDVVVFDGDVSGRHHRTMPCNGKTVSVWHASLLESESSRLLQYGQMQVLRDESWDLRALIRRVGARRDALYRDHARNSIFQSLFCCQKVRQVCNKGAQNDQYTPSSEKHASKNDIVSASCWQKCASFYLADAICAFDKKIPGPSHKLDALRNMSETRVNGHITAILDTIGMERATPTLLGRMAISTAGFADHADAAHITGASKDTPSVAFAAKHDKAGLPENTADNNSPARGMQSGIILSKYRYFISESLLSDCYFYLAYTNMKNMSALSKALYVTPDLWHILRVALDAEGDIHATMQNADRIASSCRMLLNKM